MDTKNVNLAVTLLVPRKRVCGHCTVPHRRRYFMHPSYRSS